MVLIFAIKSMALKGFLRTGTQVAEVAIVAGAATYVIGTEANAAYKKLVRQK